MDTERTIPSELSEDSGAASEQAWERVRSAWTEAAKSEQDEALAEVLRTCAESRPELLTDVFQRGIDPERPAAEQKAFARQLGILAEHDSGGAERIFRGIRIRYDRQPGLMSAALEGIIPMREADPETLALLIAETMVTADRGSGEWKKARSILFDSSHSGIAAYEIIQPALRSGRREVRRMTARWLLSELATKAQYGNKILDMIEERLGNDDDQVTVRGCIAQMPVVYARRPGQARRIMVMAMEYPHDSVQEALIRAMHRAGMADKLPEAK